MKISQLHLESVLYPYSASLGLKTVKCLVFGFIAPRIIRIRSFVWLSQQIYFTSVAKSSRLSIKPSELSMIRLAELETVFAISLLASILRRVINAGLLEIASPISWALFASPCLKKYTNIRYYKTQKSYVKFNNLYSNTVQHNKQWSTIQVYDVQY